MGRFFDSAILRLIRQTQAAPSVIWEEFPAVVVPVEEKAGGRVGMREVSLRTSEENFVKEGGVYDYVREGDGVGSSGDVARGVEASYLRMPLSGKEPFFINGLLGEEGEEGINS